MGHIVVGERKWERRKQRRGLFKGPKSEQIVPVILIGEFWWVGIFQKNSDPPTSLLTFNVGQICDIFSGKGKGESGAMLVVIMLVMLVAGDL